MNFSSRALAGCKTDNFNFSASIFTGDGRGLSSRPLGLSGCVTTAMTENFSASFSRLTRDNSAVPMKIILNSFIVAAGVSRLISKAWSGLASAATNFYVRA